MIPILLHWAILLYQSIQILGLLYGTSFLILVLFFLGCSTILIIFLIYFFSWVTIWNQYFISSFIFLGYYISPIFIFNIFNIGLVYCTMFSGDFWKTCPARCSLALCHGYFRPLPPPLWGSFAARFSFFILLIFLFIFLLSSYTGKSTWSPW